MTNQFWKKISYYVGFLPLGAIFGLTAFLATLEVKDLDLWLHLAVGKFITQNGYVPTVDILSNSIAGQPWENHEWFFQVLIYNIFNVWGIDGLLTMQTIVVVLALAMLFIIGYNREQQALMAICLTAVMLVFQQRFTIRPDIFSLFFFTIYIFVLSLHIDKKWSSILLFIVQILWVNMHGFFFFGPLFILIGIVSEWIKRHVKLPYEWNQSGRLSNDEFRRLGEIFILVVIACILNPGLFKGAWYPLGVFFDISGGHKIFFDYIQELQKPIPSLMAFFDADRWGAFKLLIFFSVVSFIINRRNIDISTFLFWLVFLIFSLKALRNTSYFAFAAYLVILNNVYAIGKRRLVPLKFTSPKFEHLTGIFIKLLILAWIFLFAGEISTRGYYDFDKYEQKSEYGGITQRGYPDKAVDFLVKNKIKGNFFNDFNSGAYMIGHVFPDIKVFIDGRTEVYGPDFFNKYRDILNEGNTELFEKAVKKFNLTGALLNSSLGPIPDKIVKYIYDSPDWVVVYFNYDAVIFLRRVEQNKEWIDKFAIDLAKWEPKQLDLDRLGVTFVTPYQAYYRAYTLGSLELDEPALKEAQLALDVDPSYGPAYEVMGKIYGRQKKFDQALHYFRIGAMFNPQKKEIRNNLAMAYADLGKYDESLKQYNALKQIWPDDQRVYLFIAKTNARKGDLAATFNALETGYKNDPTVAKGVDVVAEIFLVQKDYENLKKVYERALELQPTEETLYIKYAEAYSKEGNKDAARDILQRGLNALPENEEIKKQLKLLDDQV